MKSEKLKNGLTVLILEDHAQPLVSTQVLYKVGGRNECDGATGLAHFVEHMAFRATKNFPDTQEAIYAIGGEWHGYTWIDQTTYFETVPVEHLDSVLGLQADRMQNVLNRAEEVEAERGAVLTELHGYENDPASVLYDKVLAISFLEHPYRNNTIGWVSDVEKLTHKDIVDFYQRFYSPSNAVLAIAGDVQRERALDQVRRYFGSIPSHTVESFPRTVEPEQTGERRVTLSGSGPANYFQITYRAPAATDPDFAPFLLLQAILGGGSGVNFRQGGFGDDVRSGTRLFGISDKMTTMFVATANPYVLNIAGRTTTAPSKIEEAIEKQIASLRASDIPSNEIESARKLLLAELIFDIETTEDAAHQMAYFEGIGAFGVLAKLPETIRKVSGADIRKVAQKYLRPEQRTIGWFLPKTSGGAAQRSSAAALKEDRPGTGLSRFVAPRQRRLKNGIPVLIQTIPRSPAGFLRILLPTNTVESDADFSADDPVWRYTSLHWRFRVEDFEQTVQQAWKIFDHELKTAAVDPAALEDPEYRLTETLREMISAAKSRGEAKPIVIAVSGDLDETRTLNALQRLFGEIKPPKAVSQPLRIRSSEQVVHLSGKAQSQFGYATLAPAPSRQEAYAYRALLYIMTHGYGGRLGKDLINEKGLLYYISSNYNSDGKAAWISITFGVNPDKLNETKNRFNELMNGLRENPPTEKELSEAKEHLVGRRITAYQSNEEISAFLAREWIEQGRVLDQAEYEKRVQSVTLPQVLKIIPSFLTGARAIVDTH